MMATNALAPQVTGVTRLTDWIAQRLNPKWFPTAGRTFLESVQGNKQPITEQQFTPEELAALNELIVLKGGTSGDIQYDDYQLLGKAMRARGQLPINMYPSIMSLADPLGNVQTTLGRFSYTQAPDGSMQVQDTYDFNPPMVNGTTQEARTGEYGALGPYNLIRDYAGEKIPRGHGRNVQIKLAKQAK